MFEHFVQMACAVFDGRCAKTLANLFGALGQIGQTFHKRPQIEPRTDGENGEAAAGAQISKNG
jgi:hypothetical protein